MTNRTLSLRTFTLLVLAISGSANEIDALNLGYGWTSVGDVKVGYVNYDYDNPPPGSEDINKGHIDSKGFYTVPKVSIISPNYYDFSAKATVAAATDFGLNDPDYASRNFVFDPIEKKPFIILQEMFIRYKDNQHNLTIGRYELKTPLMEPDDYYMLADSYETVSYINTSLSDYTFYLGYIAKMAGVWDSGTNGTIFNSMSETSFVDARDKKNADDSGVFYGAAEYASEHHKLKIWEYYVTHLYNMFLAQYDINGNVSTFTYEAALQYTNYSEIGRLAVNNYTNIDYSIYALKFDGAFDNGIDMASGISKFSNGEGIGATLSAWGGFPTYTYGFIYNWFEVGDLRNALLYKIQLGYDLSNLGLTKSWIGYRYTYYDLDEKYSKTVLGESQESMFLNGLRFVYNSSDTGFYFTGNYEYRVLSHEPDSSSYRLIGGYRF